MDYADHVRALTDHDPALAEQLAPLRGMGGVMMWMAAQGIPLSSAEITQLDEFSLDCVVPLPGGRWLVLGIT
jgi:hypothetical protein